MVISVKESAGTAQEGGAARGVHPGERGAAECTDTHAPATTHSHQ